MVDFTRCCCCCCWRRCDWLDKKNTIFGKIVGDTVYNMLRLNELEVRGGLTIPRLGFSKS
jgi:hypothetical protein